MTNSHSLVIRSNSQGHQQEYYPNEFAFEYVQKRGVYYRVQYLDAATRAPLLDPVELGKDEVYTTNGSVKEDAPFIAGYNAEQMSQTLVPTASTASTEEAQKAEELETNVITFYYNLNGRDYIYEVEYWEQNANDDEYTLLESENLQVEIADDSETEEVESTYVSLADIYNGSMSQLIISTGFTRVEGATKVAVTTQGGTTTESSVDDGDSVEITGNAKTTIKIYYNRNTYPYQYVYVDYHAERAYLDTPAAERAGMWDGVMETHNSVHDEKVDATVTISAPLNLSYNNGTDTIPYKRIDNKDITLTIGPTDVDSTANLVKVYYKMFNVRELEYKLVCKNEDNEYTEVDYDDATGDPLYGGLSMTLQTVNAYNQINPVVFYDFNDAQLPNESGVMEDAHQHRYNFLGWYDNPEGAGDPLVAYDGSDPDKWMTLTKADLGLEEDQLPDDDMTYYAVVEQFLVRANFEFRYVDEDLPIGGEPIDETTGEAAKDLESAAIVAFVPSDPDGEYTGSYFAFSSPYRYQTNTPLPFQKHEGYTMNILPKEEDDRVYKYEFAEWWEEDLDGVWIPELNCHKLIRKKGWNQSGSWGAATALQDLLDRREDKHVIAVFKRREVSEMPYVIKYNFIDRYGKEQTFVKKGTLTSDQLDETNANCAVTNHGDYLLTDEFILENAPYESNYGETLRRSNREGRITKTSQKAGTVLEDGTTLSADRVIATITAVQDNKTVYAHYRTSPTGEFIELATTYGANYKLDKNMLAIEAPVDSIGDYAFYEKEAVTSVSFEQAESLRSIGICAFYGCTLLSKVSLPADVELSFGSFQKCTALSSLTIAEGISEIPTQCFFGCSALSELSLPSSVTVIGDRAFSGCAGLHRVDIPDSVIDIAQNAFDGCDDLVIYASKDSFAIEYAISNAIPYVLIDVEPTDYYVVGDSDGDTVVTILDATAIQRTFADLPVNSFDEVAADSDGKGLDILDATRIQRFLVQLDDSYSIGTIVARNA